MMTASLEITITIDKSSSAEAKCAWARQAAEEFWQWCCQDDMLKNLYEVIAVQGKRLVVLMQRGETFVASPGNPLCTAGLLGKITKSTIEQVMKFIKEIELLRAQHFFLEAVSQKAVAMDIVFGIPAAIAAA